MYLAPPAADERITADMPLNSALAITVVGILFIGIVPRFVMDVVETAVTTLV
ncbi:MAG: hypothetical protein ACE5JL_09695 [Dehalococcoidia bacterium]